MSRVEIVSERNREFVLEQLRVDPVRHVFADFDLRHDKEHTTAYVLFRERGLDGYILTYTRADVTSVILETDRAETAQKLIKHAPKDHFIMHAPPDLWKIVVNKYPQAKRYIENWMLVKKGEANYFTSTLVRRLTKEDAMQISILLQTRTERPKKTLEDYVEWLARMKMYGVFINGRLASYAGSFLQTPEIWMIGGVYTHPELRNNGYSTLATSAITEESLRNAMAAALFVRSDNFPAMRVYEKIGYRKIDQKMWVDVETGLRP